MRVSHYPAVFQHQPLAKALVSTNHDLLQSTVLLREDVLVAPSPQ